MGLGDEIDENVIRVRSGPHLVMAKADYIRVPTLVRRINQATWRTIPITYIESFSNTTVAQNYELERIDNAFMRHFSRYYNI